MFEVAFIILVGSTLQVNGAYPAPTHLTQVSTTTGATVNVFQPPLNSFVSQTADSQTPLVDLIPTKEDSQKYVLESLPLSQDASTTSSATGTTRNIFQPSYFSDVSQVSNNDLPWISPDFIPIIQEFEKNALNGLQTLPKVKAIWDFQFDRATSRAEFFNVVNVFLWNINYPVSSALANIVSKSASLFDTLSIKVFAKAVVISLAEFLLSRNIQIDISHVQRYLSYIEIAFQSADISSANSILASFLAGYGNFIASFGFKLVDEINQAIELFASELIVLHDM